jgi:PadR family transcriptional regulator, regulatory protein PadR
MLILRTLDASQCWIAGERSKTEGNRRARYYQLTPAGRKQLAKEVDQYRPVATAIGKEVLQC